MSESEHEHETEVGITDDALPEDLVPGDDNPLAEGLDPGETVGDLLHDGKTAEQDEPADDATDGSDGPEGSDET